MDENPGTSIPARDPAASIMFGIGIFLIAFLFFAAYRFGVSRHPDLLMAALLLTGVFAIAGMVLGLVRGLQSGRANKKRSA